MTKNTSGLEKYRVEKIKEKRDKVITTIEDFKTLNRTINFSRIAKASRVSRRFLYAHQDIKELITSQIPLSAERERNKVVQFKASDQSKDHKIRTLTEKCRNLQKTNFDLREEIKTLQSYIDEISQ